MCVFAWTFPDIYVHVLPVESSYSQTLVFRILTSHNYCIFLNLSWLVSVHQNKTIWLVDHSPPVKLCVSLSDVDCFHVPQLQSTSRSTVLHFVEALDCHFGVKTVQKSHNSLLVFSCPSSGMLVLGVVFKWKSEWNWYARKNCFPPK